MTYRIKFKGDTVRHYRGTNEITPVEMYAAAVEALGFTDAQMGEMLQRSFWTALSYRHGRRNVPPDVWRVIARRLGW